MNNGNREPLEAQNTLLLKHKQQEAVWLLSEKEDRGYFEEQKESSGEQSHDVTGERECTLEAESWAPEAERSHMGKQGSSDDTRKASEAPCEH